MIKNILAAILWLAHMVLWLAQMVLLVPVLIVSLLLGLVKGPSKGRRR